LSLGNDYLHPLTNIRQLLQVNMTDWDGNKRYAQFDNFRVGSDAEKFNLVTIGSYTGTAGQ